MEATDAIVMAVALTVIGIVLAGIYSRLNERTPDQ